MKKVIARTKLGAKKDTEYIIHFCIDEYGHVNSVWEKKNKVRVKPYQLIHLLNKVYNELGITPHQTVKCDCMCDIPRHGKVRIVLFTGRTRYLLNQEVNCHWINVPNIESMCKFVNDLKDDKKNPIWDLVYVYKSEGYKLLDSSIVNWIVEYK